MSTEQRAVHSRKSAACRDPAKLLGIKAKAAAAATKEAEFMQFLQARANAEVLAKQAVVQGITMLKGDVVNPFTVGHLGSTASSLLSTAATRALWLQPPSPAAHPDIQWTACHMSSTSSLLEISSMLADGVVDEMPTQTTAEQVWSDLLHRSI
jgi:hypothetical protein